MENAAWGGPEVVEEAWGGAGTVVAAWTAVRVVAGRAAESESESERARVSELSERVERIEFGGWVVASNRGNNEGYPLSRVGFSSL